MNLSTLLVPWDEEMSKEESLYKSRGFVKTCGTVFCDPPNYQELVESFTQSHYGRKLSVGARALCKHYERRKDVDKDHQYWQKPMGSEENKYEMALHHLTKMLKTATWKNIHRMHPGVIVYEIRNEDRYGMRWSFEPECAGSCKFRGFLEPEPEWTHCIDKCNDNEMSPQK